MPEGALNQNKIEKTEPRMPEENGGHLNDNESHALRKTLAAVGVLGVVYGSYKSLEDYEGEQIEKDKPTAESVESEDQSPSEDIIETPDGQQFTTAPEQVKSPENFSEAVEGELLKWQQWWSLGPQEVAFYDAAHTTPLRTVAFSETEIDKDGDGTNEYLLTPGVLDDDGFAREGVAAEWLQYQREQLAEEFGVPVNNIAQQNVITEFNAALNNEDEPALAAGIRGGKIRSMAEVVQYFGFSEEKVVRGDEKGRTRAQYLAEEITFSEDVPSYVQESIRELIVAQAAKESRFDAGLSKNHMTAWGIMQLIDAVREEHGFDPDQRLSFQEEVDVAGKHFSNIYTRVNHWLTHTVEKIEGEWQSVDRPETLERLRALYPNNEEGERLWQEFVIVPSMINAYNAGSRRIGEAWYIFVQAHSNEQLQVWANNGLELFLEFTKFSEIDDSNQFTAAFGQDAGSYFWSIKGGEPIFNLFQEDSSG